MAGLLSHRNIDMMDMYCFIFTFKILFIYLYFGHAARGILVPQPGIEPAPPAVKAWSLNHWTSREVPDMYWFKLLSLW